MPLVRVRFFILVHFITDLVVCLTRSQLVGTLMYIRLTQIIYQVIPLFKMLKNIRAILALLPQ